MNYIDEWLDTLDKVGKCKFIGFEGIRVDKFLTIPAKEIINREISTPSLVKTILSLLNCTFSDGYYYDFKRIEGTKNVLFYSHLHARRSDYVRFMRLVESCSEDASLFTGESRVKLDKVYHFGIDSFLLLFRSVIWYIELKKKSVSSKFLKTFIVIMIQMYRWYSILEHNKEKIKTIGSLISLFDAREFENVFTQYCNNLGITTATLQHGHFGERTYINNNCFYFDIAYKGFVSNYFLAWGEYSKRIAIKTGINEKQVILVGCPEFIVNNKITGLSGVVGVVFDGGEETHNDNRRMLQIAKSFSRDNNYRIVIKLHPSEKKELYSDVFEDESICIFEGDINKYANNVEFSICCNSSVLIQLLSYGSVVYRFEPSDMYDMYSLLKPWSFRDYETFLKVYKNPAAYFETLSELSVNKDVKELYHKTLKNISN